MRRILDNGNDMLKNSSGGVSNVADLARNMINLNAKWSNLNKRVEAKNKTYIQLGEYINELRRKLTRTKSLLKFRLSGIQVLFRSF